MMNPSTTTPQSQQSQQQLPPSAGKLLIEALRSSHDGFFGLHLFSKSLLSKSLGFSFILGPRFQEKKAKEKSEETEEELAEDSPLSFYKNLLSYQDILDINILGLPIALDDVVTSTRLFLESQADSEKVLEFSVRNLVADRRFDGCCFGASSTTISNSKNANDDVDDQNNKNKNKNNKHQDEDFEREVQQGIALCKTIFHFVVTGKRHRMGLPQNWGESLIRMTRCRIFASITRLLCRGLFLADWQNKIKNHPFSFGAAVGSNSSSESIMTKTSSASSSSYNFSNTSAPIMTFPLVNIHQIEILLSQERTRLHSASVNFSLSQQELPPNLQNHSLHHPSAAANTSILSSLTSIPSVSQQQLFSLSSASLQQQQKFFTDLCPEVYASFPPNEDHFLRTTQEGLLHDAMNIFSIDPGVAAVHPWRLDAKMLLTSLCLLQEEDDDDENGNRSKMKNKNNKNENFGSLSSFGCGSLTWGNQNEDDEDEDGESNNQKKKKLRRVGFADIDASALGRVIAHAPLRRKNNSKKNMPTSNDDFDYDDQEDQEEHSTLYSGLDALQTFLNIVVSGSSLTHKKCLALMMMMTNENDEEDKAEKKDEYYQKMIRNNPYFRLFSKKMKKSSSSSKHHRQISASIFPKSSSSYVLGGEEEDENESDEEQDTTTTLVFPPRHLFLIKTLLSHPLSMKREKILEVNVVTPSGLHHHHTSNNTSEEEKSISEQNISTSSSTSSSSSTMIMINHETQSSTQNQYGIEIVWNPRKFAQNSNNINKEQNTTSSDNLNNNSMIVPQLSSLVKRCFELLPFDEQSETIPLNFFVDQRQQQNQNQNDDDDDEDDDDEDEFLQNMTKNRQDELNREPSLASTMIDPPSTIPADGDEDDSSSEDDDNEENDNPSSPSPDRKSKTTGTTTKTSSSSAASSSSKTTTAANNNSIIFDEVLQDETIHIFKRFPNLRGMALVELCGFPLPGKKFSQMIFGSPQQHTNNTNHNNDNSNNNQEFISNPFSNYSNLESFWDTTGTHSKERRREIRKRRKQLLRNQQQQENASTSITTEDFHRDLDSACSPLRLQISQQVKLFSSSVDSFSLRATMEQFLIHCSRFKTSSSSNSHQATSRRNKNEDDERLDIVSYLNSSIFPPPPPNKKNNNKNMNEPSSSSPTSSSLLLMNREQGQAVLMKTSHSLDDEKEQKSSSSSSSEDEDFFESSSSSSSSSFASSSTFSSSDEDDEQEAEEDSPDQQFYAHLLRHCGIAETLKQFETFTNPKFLPFTPCVENLNQFVRGLCFSSTTSYHQKQQQKSSSFYIAEILLVGLLKSIPLAEAFSLIELCIQSITTFSIQNEHCLSQQQQEQQTSSSTSDPASSSSTTNDDGRVENDERSNNKINDKKKIKSSSLETISPQDSVSQQGSQTTILRQEETENNSDTSKIVDEEEKEKVPKPSTSDDSTTSVSNNQNPTSNPSSSSSVAASSSASSVYLGFFTRCLRHSPTNIENFRSEFFFETGLMQIFPLLSSYALLIKTLLISLQNSEEITQKHLLAEEERKRNLQQHQIPPPYQQQQQNSKKKNKKIIINQKQQNKSKNLQKLETLRQNLISDDVKLQALQFADTVLALLPDWTSTCLQLLENTNSAINRKEFNLKYLASLGCMDAAFVPRLLAEKSHVFGPLLSCTCLLSCEIPQHLYNKNNNQNKNQNKNLPLCSDRTAQDILNTVDQLSIRIDEEFIRTIGRSFKLARDTIGVRLLLSSSPEDESSSSDEENDDESKTSSSSSSVWPLFCRRAELVKKIFGTRVSFAALQLLSEDGNESLNPLLKLRMFSKFTSGVLKDSSSFL